MNILFHGEEKTFENGQKRTIKGYCANPPLERITANGSLNACPKNQRHKLHLYGFEVEAVIQHRTAGVMLHFYYTIYPPHKVYKHLLGLFSPCITGCKISGIP